MNRLLSTLVLFVFLVFQQSNASQHNDSLPPWVPMAPQIRQSCPVTASTPFSLTAPCKGTSNHPLLQGCSGIWIGIGCNQWNEDEYSSLNFNYFIKNSENEENIRSFEVGLYHESLEKFIESAAHGELLKSEMDGHLVRSSEGLPQLAKEELIGNCGQEKSRQVSVTPITGPNWTGWMWEQSFAAPKRKLKASCQKFTPEYRCVALVFGNDKMSASFPTYCFLLKKVDNLDTELSFDVFMDMIKTIHFNEGSIESASGNMK